MLIGSQWNRSIRYWLEGVNDCRKMISRPKQYFCNAQCCNQPSPTPLSFRQLVFPLSVIGLSLLPQLGEEQPASSGYISSNPQHVQAAAENWTFHSLLRSAVFLCMQTFCLILSYCCTARFYIFFLCCSSSLWTQCHYNNSRLIIMLICSDQW